MSIKAGTSDITKIQLGSTEVAKVYQGSTEIWSAVPPLPPGTVDVMILAGGGGHSGGGGPQYMNAAGGGGAGGMLEIEEFTVSLGQTYNIVVGAGGSLSGNESSIKGQNVNWVAERGGGQMSGGGCGGGEMGSLNQAPGWMGETPEIEGQGFGGGLSEANANQTAGGGGGGTDGKGDRGRCIADLAMAGGGGLGRQTKLDWTVRLGGGGGGGATTYNGSPGQSSFKGYGGTGGGGEGGMDGNAGQPGQQNTGGGAGGGSYLSSPLQENYGGSGQVWICSNSPAAGTTGNPTVLPWNNNRTMYKFLGSGSIRF